MIRLVIPTQVPAEERRQALAAATRDWHNAQVLRRCEAHLGRLLRYHQAKRAERAAKERMRAWQAVQMPERVA